MRDIPELQSGDLTDLVRITIEQNEALLDGVLETNPSTIDLANAYAALGEVYLAHELMVQAEVAFSNALTLMPGRSDWHYLAGIIEQAEGRIDAAVAAYDRALDQAFPDVLFPALIRRGRALLEQGDWARARADFDRALQFDPESAAAIGGLGRVALRSGDAARAELLLKQALALDPLATQLHQQLGLTYRELGRIDEARAELALAGQGQERFLDPVLSGVQQQSVSPQLYLESGLAQAELGDYDAAAGSLSAALQLDPDNVNILSNYGNVLARIGRYDLARSAYQKMTQLEPGNPEGWLGLGRLSELEGEETVAMNQYRRALGVDPGHDPARAAMAYLLLAQGEAGEALALFQQLTERGASVEEQARWWYWQGIAQIGLNDCAASNQSLEQSLTLGGLNPSNATALARLRSTCLDATADQLQQASTWTEAIYEATPNALSAETLAMVYAALERFDDAVDLQAQAMFELLRDGLLDDRPHLRSNMQRYEQRQPALQPFADNDAVFVGQR
ncbi:MAG: tetratricopeptide repeat protein [Pseudomonadota bacterium]